MEGVAEIRVAYIRSISLLHVYTEAAKGISEKQESSGQWLLPGNEIHQFSGIEKVIKSYCNSQFASRAG